MAASVNSNREIRNKLFEGAKRTNDESQKVETLVEEMLSNQEKIEETERRFAELRSEINDCTHEVNKLKDKVDHEIHDSHEKIKDLEKTITRANEGYNCTKKVAYIGIFILFALSLSLLIIRKRI